MNQATAEKRQADTKILPNPATHDYQKDLPSRRTIIT